MYCKLSIAKCVEWRHCKEFVGYARELLPVEISSEQVIYSEEDISFEDEQWWFNYIAYECIQYYDKSFIVCRY